MTDIPAYPTFTKIEPPNKGWSSDKKYYVETRSGERLLLRVADIAEYDNKKAEFENIKRVANLGVPIARPVDIGVCDGGKRVYQLLTWIDGEDLESVLPTRSEAEQYSLGVKSGEILRKIHSIPAPDGTEKWSKCYFAIIDERLDAYRAEGTPFEGNDIVLAYLENNRGLLKDLPQTFIHGDYHDGNIMLGNDGNLYIIDFFNEYSGYYGEPWQDLKPLEGCESAHYATGVVQGYFDGEPPQKFWDVLNYYTVTAALTAIVWYTYNRPDELPRCLSANVDNAAAIRAGRSTLPSWYLSDFYIQYIDGVPFKLKSSFDFSFISKYGTVFKVFDSQDSGNICFGVQSNDGKRFFVKFAGAPMERYNGEIADAVSRLKETVPIYQDLAHPHLIRFVKAEEIGGGFVMLFEWVDAICAGRQYPLDHQKFSQLSHETKLQILDEIMAFMAFVAERGYVAIDFYDGSIMWDLSNNRTVICDIDFFQKSPYVGRMGLWASSRFISPEERTDGAVIDAITNVYTLGATAFAIFADSDRSREAWTLSDEQYAVVKRAVSNNRSERQQSIRQLIEEWRSTK